MMRKQNLHLVAYYAIKPKDPKRTKEAGYMKDPNNYAYDESINITKGLKEKDRLEAKVILNLSDQTVIKNRFNELTDFPSLLSYYQEGYPKYLNPLIEQLYSEKFKDGNVNVQGKEEEGSRSERTTEANALGPREGNENMERAV